VPIDRFANGVERDRTSVLPPRPRLFRTDLLLAVGAAIVLRMAACGVWAHELTIDRDLYLGLAEGLADGRGFCAPETTNPTAFRPPMYPWVLSLLLPRLGKPMAVAAVNIVCGAITVVLTAKLAQLCWLPRLPTAGALAWVVCNPLLLRYTPQPMTEAVFTALHLALIVGLGRALTFPTASTLHDRRTGVFWAGLGLLSGVTVLCRPTVGPFVAAVALGLFVTAIGLRRGPTSDPSTKAWSAIPLPLTLRRHCLAFIAGLALVIVPWVVRNQQVLGHPVFTTTHGGYTLALGNNEVFYREVARQPWGTVWSGDSLDRWQRDMAHRKDQQLGPGASEVASDRWFSEQARSAMQADPVGCGWAIWYRLRSLWNPWPRVTINALPSAVLGVVSLMNTAVLFAALIGLCVLCRRRSFAAVLMALAIVSVQAVHLLYWTDTRMRTPLEPLVAVCAAAVLTIRPSRGEPHQQRRSETIAPVNEANPTSTGGS
jgi:hypothetical protein